MSNLENISIFIKVARSGSYTKAADEFSIPIATISRRIKSLEESLGVNLINRDTRKISLTEAGYHLYENSYELLKRIEDIEKETADFQTSFTGKIRITMPVDISYIILNNILADFMAENPELELDVFITNDLVDIVEEGYDLAIRGGSSADSNLIFRKIMSSRLYLCCTPEYIKKYGEPTHPEDLKNHNIITFDHGFYKNLKLSKNDEIFSLNIKSRLKTNSLDMISKCILRSFAIGLLPKSICESQIGSKKIVPLLSNWSPPEVSLYALYPNRNKTQKLKLLIDYIEEKLGQYGDNIIA